MNKRSLTYTSWQAMLERCRRIQRKNWGRYGGRGIRVCERWSVFRNFVEDMGERPGRGYTIERIDNDGHYEPGNCKWATWEEQALNRAKRLKGPKKKRVLTPEQYERKKVNNRLWRKRNPARFREYKRISKLRKRLREGQIDGIGIKVEGF